MCSYNRINGTQSCENPTTLGRSAVVRPAGLHRAGCHPGRPRRAGRRSRGRQQLPARQPGQCGRRRRSAGRGSRRPRSSATRSRTGRCRGASSTTSARKVLIAMGRVGLLDHPALSRQHSPSTAAAPRAGHGDLHAGDRAAEEPRRHAAARPRDALDRGHRCGCRPGHAVRGERLARRAPRSAGHHAAGRNPQPRPARHARELCAGHEGCGGASGRARRARSRRPRAAATACPGPTTRAPTSRASRSSSSMSPRSTSPARARRRCSRSQGRRRSRRAGRARSRRPRPACTGSRSRAAGIASSPSTDAGSSRPTPSSSPAASSFPALHRSPRTAACCCAPVTGSQSPSTTRPACRSRGAELHLGWEPPNPKPIQQAVAAAKRAQVAVVFANDSTSEGADRASLALPGDQDRLIEAVALANHHTIVVLHTAGPVLMPWRNKVAAIVEAWYPGQMSGASDRPDAVRRRRPVRPTAGDLACLRAAGPNGDHAGVPRHQQHGPVRRGIFVGYRYYDHSTRSRCTRSASGSPTPPSRSAI